ncbi:MAG: DUF1570 domain-containing protein [Planctomycetota bacterium]
MTRWLTLLTCIWLFCPSPALAEPAPEAGAAARQAGEEIALRGFRSRHYVIYTNLSREETLPYGRHMDRVFDQYQRRFASFMPRNPDPMPLYLLRTREQYIRYLANYHIDASNAGGMFFVTHAAQGLATWVESGSRQKTFRILQHEGFHQFAWNYLGPNLPVWLNEGLAQYFEDAILTNQGMQLGIPGGTRIERVHRAIEQDNVLSFEQLRDVTAEHWGRTLRNRPDQSSLLYAQSWSVVYFLIHADEGRHKDRLLHYLKLLNRGSDNDQAWLMSFGTAGLAALEQSWRGYASRQKPSEIATATDRLVFLGTGLRLLDERGQNMPGSIDQLRDELQRFGFSLRKRELGIIRDQSAQDEELFRFERGMVGGKPYEAEFRLLTPSRSDLPPRIVAPGLSPEPTLIWYRDADGDLVLDIEYR